MCSSPEGKFALLLQTNVLGHVLYEGLWISGLVMGRLSGPGRAGPI